MSTVNLIFSILLIGIAVSYGWGMRGAVIGGEKGAMLPGALLGFFLAKLSGVPDICDNAMIFSAIGCLSMGYGGFETYAQTMGMILHKSSEEFDPKRGYIGLMIKGGNWFGICGSLLGIGFISILGDTYSRFELITLFAIIPFIQALGIKLFNKPYNKTAGIFPKIYFSYTRREEWGGNLLTLAIIILFTAVKRDWFSFFFAITGIFSGAFGWAVSIWLYDVTVHPNKKGNFIFGRLQEKGHIDNWKIMEFALGFLGGGGLGAYFLLNCRKIQITQISVYSSPEQNTIAITAFCLAVLMSIQYFIKKLESSRFFELFERAVYFSIILCICVLGNLTMARLVTFLLILWVAVEKIVFDELGNTKKEKIIKLLYLLVFFSALIGEIFLTNSYPDFAKMLMYTYFYILTDFISVCNSPNRNTITLKERFKGCYTVHIWFNVLSITILFFI